VRDDGGEPAVSPLTVYCGHARNIGTAHMLSNLTVFTGSTEYGTPQVNEVIGGE
jgi:hypothetical protein